jgi:hypothetical protein
MRLPRLKIATVLTLIIVVALALALLAQHLSGERHDRALKTQLGRALMDKYAQEGMDRILTDQGTDIFKHCLSVEVLRTSTGTVTSTGIMLEKDIALKAACVLLDHRNFGGAGDCDDPLGADAGLRIRDGHSALDLLISLDWSHQDIWININDESEKQVHSSRTATIHDPILQKLGKELLGLLSQNERNR